MPTFLIYIHRKKVMNNLYYIVGFVGGAGGEAREAHDEGKREAGMYEPLVQVKIYCTKQGWAFCCQQNNL